MGFQETFKALSDPTRREILHILRDGAKTAGEIGSHFAMTGATISHHLAVLREAGLVTDDKRGKHFPYLPYRQTDDDRDNAADYHGAEYGIHVLRLRRDRSHRRNICKADSDDDRESGSHFYPASI